MKHLLLFRHAKSSWADPGLNDFERPLNERGERAAMVMAHCMAQHMPLPDVILCSTAQRTRQTMKPLLDKYRHSMDICLRRDLYHCEAGGIVKVLRQQEAGDVVMVIGHNPGLEDCAHRLCGSGEAELRREMSHKFPTAACAYLTFNVQSWSEAIEGQGHLNAFIKPRDLAD